MGRRSSSSSRSSSKSSSKSRSSRSSRSSSPSSSFSSHSLNKRNSSSDNYVIPTLLAGFLLFSNASKKPFEENIKKMDKQDIQYLVEGRQPKNECKSIYDKYVLSATYYPNDYLFEVLKNELKKCDD